MKKKRAKRQQSKLSIDELEARSVVLVDEYGSQRVRLWCDGGDGGIGGFTKLQMNDDKGNPRIEIQIDHQGNPSIRLLTTTDGGGVSIAVNEGLGNGLSIGDHEGNPLISIGVPDPDSPDPRGPHISVINPEGNVGWSAFNGTYAISPQASDQQADSPENE